jgi:hypothetical protein
LSYDVCVSTCDVATSRCHSRLPIAAGAFLPVYSAYPLDTREHRFARGRLLIRYMDDRFPGHAHLERIVPGIAHSSRCMFTSQVGVEVLFE